MRHAFLVYNPVTGETSPWIEMNKKPEKYSRIAFGFDPQSDEHKVICISSSTEYNWREKISNRPKDQVVDVFTVGKNTWRRIDATPPIAIGCEEDPFYVDGCLYWRFRQEYKDGELENIMRFDIVTEKFRVIPIPDFVIDPDSHKFTQTVGLTEIDGRIAVLDWVYELEISLWTFHEDADGNIKWTEEVVDMPPYWNGKYDLSIETLTGTDLIFLRSECADRFFLLQSKHQRVQKVPNLA